MRTIASTGGVLGDASEPLAHRGARVLKDTIAAIEEALVDYVLEVSYDTNIDFSASMRALDILADQLTAIHIATTTIETSRTESAEGSTQTEAGISLAVGRSVGLDISTKDTSQAKDSHSNTVRRVGSEQDHVTFHGIQTTLAAVVRLLPAKRVWILLDEWTDVPRDLQPILAEFLRRCLFPVEGIIVKLGAIEKRANFVTHGTGIGEYLGLELGADIAGDADLDDYFCLQHEDDRDREFMADLIFSHLRTIDATLIRNSTAPELVGRIFAEPTAFGELVLSAAGVPRDALNVLRIAAQRAQSRPLTVRIVRDAVRAWYNKDKLAAIAGDTQARDLFFEIVRRVVGERQHTCFALRNPDMSHRVLNKLFDARLVHIVKRDIQSQADVTLRYTLFRIDSGAYIDISPDRLSRASTRYDDHAEYPVVDLPTK
jgi:hypothetical protein